MSIELSKVKENNYNILFNNKVCGEVEYVEKNEGIKIESISIKDIWKRKGIATNIISELLQKTNYIYGDCLPNNDSISFWSNVGAEFEEDVEECIESNTCIPFSIN